MDGEIKIPVCNCGCNETQTSIGRFGYTRLFVATMQCTNCGFIVSATATDFDKAEKSVIEKWCLWLEKVTINYTKTVLALDCARAAFLLCFQQKRRRFFDHRRIHQKQRQFQPYAIYHSLLDHYGTDKRRLYRAISIRERRWRKCGNFTTQTRKENL